MAMNADLEVEIHRVVTSPYPTQLKTLHDHVEKTTDAAIQSWAASHPCQVGVLARIVTDALSTWPFTLDIVTRLSVAVALRNAFLTAQPLLLDQIIGAAVEGQGTRARYVSPAVALLKYELPSSIPLPATAQTLLVRLFDNAATCPERTTICVVHTILNGACRPLLGVLSADVLHQFEQQVFGILREATDIENQSLGLYCLSIMDTLLKGACAITPNRDWTPDAMQSFFTGSKAHKTLQLVVLRVIWACKTGSNDASDEGQLCVKLANDLLQAVDARVRQEWCAKNAAMVRKLHEKSLLPGLSPHTRFQVVAFIGCLLEPTMIPSRAIETYEHLLTGKSCFDTSDVEFDEILRLSFPNFAPSLSSQYWERFLHGIMDARLKDDPFSNEISHILSVMHYMASMAEKLPRLREAAIFHGDGHSLEQLKALLSLSDIAPGSNACAAAVQTRYYKYRVATCNVLLRVAYAGHQESEPCDVDLVSLLLDWRANAPMQSSCTHSYDLSRAILDPVDLIETNCTPSDFQTAPEWRDRLGSVLQVHAKQQKTSLVSAFSQICQGLEERCNNVEGPLRVQREQYKELETRYQELESAYGTLEGHMMDRDLHISSLEADNERLGKQSEDAEGDKDQLLRRVNECERRLKETNEKIRADLELSREERARLDLDHAAALTGEREALDQSRDECDQLRKRLNVAESDGQGNAEANAQARKQVEELEAHAAQLVEKLQNAQNDFGRCDAERRQAIDRSVNLESEIKRQRNAFGDLRRDHDTATVELGELRVRSRQQLERATTSFEETLSETRQKYERSYADLQQQLENIEQGQLETEGNYEAANKKSEAKMQEMRKKIDRLIKDCTKKDAQVAEAQEMRNRLVNAMGLNAAAVTASPPKHSTLPYRSASSASTPYTQPPITPARPASQPNPDDADSNLSFGSFASSQNGPTPKRSKPRKAFKVPALQQPRASLGGLRSVKSVSRASAMKRQPLANMSPNRSPARATRSPARVAFKDVEGANGPMSTGARNALAEWSFDTDVLTSTPGKALGARYDELDESTADA